MHLFRLEGKSRGRGELILLFRNAKRVFGRGCEGYNVYAPSSSLQIDMLVLVSALDIEYGRENNYRCEELH